jgi:membrane protein implicated in regulation of membrane protease activity
MSTITIWVLLGTGLLVTEMLTGTFFLLFLSLGAFAASLAALFGMESIPMQIVICAIIACLGFFLLKKPLQKKLLKTASVQIDQGQIVRIDHSLPAGQSTRINYQGTTWEARNTDSVDLNPGDQGLIVGTEGHILLLKKSIPIN